MRTIFLRANQHPDCHKLFRMVISAYYQPSFDIPLVANALLLLLADSSKEAIANGTGTASSSSLSSPSSGSAQVPYNVANDPEPSRVTSKRIADVLNIQRQLVDQAIDRLATDELLSTKDIKSEVTQWSRQGATTKTRVDDKMLWINWFHLVHLIKYRHLVMTNLCARKKPEEVIISYVCPVPECPMHTQPIPMTDFLLRGEVNIRCSRCGVGDPSNPATFVGTQLVPAKSASDAERNVVEEKSKLNEHREKFRACLEAVDRVLDQEIEAEVLRQQQQSSGARAHALPPGASRQFLKPLAHIDTSKGRYGPLPFEERSLKQVESMKRELERQAQTAQAQREEKRRRIESEKEQYEREVWSEEERLRRELAMIARTVNQERQQREQPHAQQMTSSVLLDDVLVDDVFVISVGEQRVPISLLTETDVQRMSEEELFALHRLLRHVAEAGADADSARISAEAAAVGASRRMIKTEQR